MTGRYYEWSVAASLAALVLAFYGCNGGGDSDEGPIPLTVPKAACGSNDKPESGRQGQVPAAVRASGFQGFSCNLQLIGQYKGDGASWQHAFFQDKSGTKCNYYDTSIATANRTQTGTVVLDVSQPTAPTPTAYLTTQSMLDPWESLKVNERRQMLGAEYSVGGTGTGQLDLYDIADDCRNPRLLSSVLTGSSQNGDAAAFPAGQDLGGHEGDLSPDGPTWHSGGHGTPQKYP